MRELQLLTKEEYKKRYQGHGTLFECIISRFFCATSIGIDDKCLIELSLPVFDGIKFLESRIENFLISVETNKAIMKLNEKDTIWHIIISNYQCYLIPNLIEV